jgi:signal transduction histidine kinase
MISKIKEYLLPPKHYKDLMPREKVNYLAKSKMVILFTLIFISAFSLIFYMRITYIENVTTGIYLLPFTIILATYGLIRIRRRGDLNFLIWLFTLTLTIVLPLRIYNTGGLESPAIAWFITGIFAIFNLHSFKNSLILTIIVTLEFAIICFLNPPDYENYKHIRIAVFCSAFFVAILAQNLIEKKNVYLNQEVKKLEQLNAINVMITTLSHNINNPLAIGMATISRKLRTTTNEKDKEEFNIAMNQFKRISEIVKEIQKIQTIDAIDLEEYVKGQNMLKLEK